MESARFANGYHEANNSSDEDGVNSDMSNVSKSSSFSLQESRGCCNAPCCCHMSYICLFLIYIVIFPLWGKWLVSAPMPFNFWHDNLPAFPLLPIKDFTFAGSPGVSPDIEVSAIPMETSACNYTCGVEYKHFRSNLMNFPVEMTLQKSDLTEVNAHTTYPVLLASEDFEHWQLVGDRRNAYPDPFWSSNSEVSGNTFTYTSQQCTTKRKISNESFTSKGTYIIGCVTWDPVGQDALLKAKSMTIEDIRKHCTVVGGSCGWPCGSSIPSTRLPGCDASGNIDPSYILEQTAEMLEMGTVRIEGCLNAVSKECTTSSLPMSEWKCHKCSVEESSMGSDDDEDEDGEDGEDGDDEDSGGGGDSDFGFGDLGVAPGLPPPPKLPSLTARRLQDDDEDESVIVRYKSLPRMQVRLQNARPPGGVSVLNTPRAYILAAHQLDGPWLKLYEDKPSEFAPPRPVDAPESTDDGTVVNDQETLYAMKLERRNTLHIESQSCFGRRGPLYIVACAVNSSIYDDVGLWHGIKGEPRFEPGQEVAPPPFNDRCLAVAGVCGYACVSQQSEMPFCRDGKILQEYLVGHIESEFNRVPAVIAFVCVLLCGFAVKCLMLCPGIFSPYRHAHAYEPEMTESFKYVVVVSPVAGADENKGTMLRNLIGVVSGMPPDCRCRYHAVINDEGHRNEMKTCWMLFCKIVEHIPNFGYRTYEDNLLEFTHLWCQETKMLSLAQIGGKVKTLDPTIIERLSGKSTLKKLLKESKWSTFDAARISTLDAACEELSKDLTNNYNKFTIAIPYLDNIGDWTPKDASSTALRLHYTSRAKPVEDARNIMVQHVAVGSWFYKVPKHATTEDWLQLRTNCKEMVYAVPDRDTESYNVPLRSSHGKAGGLNFVDNYMSLVARRPENIYHDDRDEAPTLYAIADARHQFQPDFMLSCIPCFFTEDGDLNHQVAFTQAPQHYPEYADKDDYMDYNNAQFFRLNAMIRNCCGGVSSCGTNGMWLIPSREDDTIWQKRRKRVRDRDSKKRDELIEREQFHTSCKIEDTASSLDQVLVGRHSHFVNRKLSFGMAKAPTDFIGAQQRWVEGAVTLSLQWFSFNADAHGQAAKNAWMLWLTVLTFLSFILALFALVCYSGDITSGVLSTWGPVQALISTIKDQLQFWITQSSVMYQILGGNDLNKDVFVNLFIQFFLWITCFVSCFVVVWFVTVVCKCFKRCCFFPNEMRWWGRLIISMDNLTYFMWFWTSFFWIGFNYYCALFKMNYHFNNKGMMAFMLCVNVINWSMIICNTFRYNVMESMDANEIAALNMDNIWRSNQLFFMTGPIQFFSLVRGIGEFVKYKFYGQDIGGWSGGDLGTISVNIVKYWTTLMLIGCVSVWIAFAVYSHKYQNAFSACIVVTLISLDVLHPCTFLWLGNVKLPQEEINKMSWFECFTTKRWWQLKVKNFILNTTFTGVLKYLAPGYFLVLPFLALFSSYFGVSGAYMLVAMGPGH